MKEDFVRFQKGNAAIRKTLPSFKGKKDFKVRFVAVRAFILGLVHARTVLNRFEQGGAQAMPVVTSGSRKPPRT
jgi:hypothetical protein